jgi:hypothetical protein
MNEPMGRIILKSLVIMSLLACLFACTALAQDMPFIGTWEWVSTEYASGEIENPGTLGHNVELGFGFSSGPTFVRYHNEVPVEEGLWSATNVFVGPCCLEILVTDLDDDWVWQTWQDNDGTWLRLQTGFQCPPEYIDPPSKIETYSLRSPVASQEMSWGSIKAGYR